MSTWNYDKSGQDGPADENNKEEAEQREAGKNEMTPKTQETFTILVGNAFGNVIGL